MRLIDVVRPFRIHIGIGEHYGTLFATKLGTRGEKDNILLGDTVITADFMEDKCAGEDQIAITKEIYIGLKTEDSDLASIFQRKGNYYITTVGYKKHKLNISERFQRENTVNNNYNGAWGDEL